MDELPRDPTHVWERSPTIFLRGENLEYYKNIEYLKQVTRQANALLDRSNARYENILDDQKLGYKVRAKSNSDSSKSISPELEGKCRKCGLAHGTANFCIVEQIMDNERQIEEGKRKSKLSKGSWKSFMSVSMDSKTLKHQMDLTADEATTKKSEHKSVLENINILDTMSYSQVLDTFETLRAQYGTNAGHKFLLANARANPPEQKIEQWMTPAEQHPKKIPELSKKPLPHYEYISRRCPKATPSQLAPLCPEISEEVRQKLETQVHLIPPCQGQPLYNREKNWRAVFRKHPPKPAGASSKGEVWREYVDFESSSTEESCACKNQTCVCGTEKLCTTPKVEKKCVITSYEKDYDNNYLLTVRKKIWERRETKRTETQLFSRQIVAPVVKGRTRTEDFLDNAEEEHYKTLKNCLADNMKNEEYDHKEFDKNVHKIAEMTSPQSAINPRQWDHWLDQLKEQQKIEERDEIDSLPSDIHTDQEDHSMISHSTGIDYKPRRIKPSRIPYAEDVYDLIDNLYDKITRKFEKSVLKNSFKTSRMAHKPTYAFLRQRMTLVSTQRPLLHEIMACAKFPSYPKRLTPYRVRKFRKKERSKALQRALVRTERRRAMIRGLQLGKQYRKVDQSYKYAPDSGYVGFKPQERKMLDPNEPERFAKFNLIRDPLGKAITMKRIHHDFRLMSRMFEDAAQEKREDLMDQGMLERLFEFQKRMYNVQQPPNPILTDTNTEDEGHTDFTYQRPPREDVQLLQRVNREMYVGHDHANQSKQASYDNVPANTRQDPAKRRSAEKSSSADKLKNIGETSHSTSARKIKNRHSPPHVSTSSTNVKEEKIKYEEKSPPRYVDLDSKQNLKTRSSVKSLTNLLPPLKGHNSKPVANNEFEESILSLQSELSSLLTQQGHVQQAVDLINTGVSNKKTSGSKKRRSAVTKLPELKTSSRKPFSKTGKRTVSGESLPHIKQEESAENLKPGRSQEKLPKRGLAKKTSMLNIRSRSSKSLKLPLLVENRKLTSNASNESLSKTRKSALQSRRQAIPKRSSVKAWR